MIEFRSVTKQFPDGTVAVDEFSLTIPSRRTTVLVGSSGCGKTTLLRMINRMVEPTGGQILIDGETWPASIRSNCAAASATSCRTPVAAASQGDRQRRDRAAC